MRKILRLAALAVICCYFLLVGRFARDMREARLCTDIRITVTDSLKGTLVRMQDIRNLIEPNEVHYIGMPLSSIPLLDMEQRIRAYPLVKQADVYSTSDGVLHVEIGQRFPILRIINAYQEHFYIDEEGRVLSHLPHFSAHIPVVTGEIRVHPADLPAVIRRQKPGVSPDCWQSLFELALFLQKDPFWKAQIQEIHVLDNQEFRLIPSMGPPIIFGPWEDARDKFDRLFTLYRKGLPAVGWDKYRSINVKYKGQIICTKK